MRLGVFCSDDRAATLLSEWNRAAEFVVVPVAGVVPTWLDGLRGVTRRNQWEELLTDPHLDAVFVGGTHPEVLQAARKFAQAGKPLWVLPHPGQGLLFAYELNLAAEETQAPLKAVFPHRNAAVWQQYRSETTTAAQSPDYVEFTRRLPVPSANSPALSVNEVDAQLLMDLDLLAWQLGRRSRVTVMRTGAEGTHIRRQTVTLAGEGVPEILWSIEPMHADRTTAECCFHCGDQQQRFQEANGVWTRTNNGTAITELTDPFVAVVAWSAVVTAFELFDAVEHSLERHRTVELHREPVSERAIFKTRMAAWGCGVLIGTLFLMLLFLMVASVVPLNGTLLNLGRALVFAPLFLFLLAQVLLPLTRPAPRP